MCTISLKELTEKYTPADIFLEASKKYTFFYEDFISLSHLIEKIKNSQNNNNGGMDIVPMIAFLGKGKNLNTISYGGFQKNGRHYKFTTKNCCNIDKMSRCKIQIPDSFELSDISFVSEYMPHTELELLVIILLSINAFSQEIIDCYFDGESKNANSIAYICELIKNNDSFIKNLC